MPCARSRPWLRNGFRVACAAAALMATTELNSAQAIDYPWCLQAGGFNGGFVSCGYVSFAQCRATASGENGFCIPNPRLQHLEPGPRAYGYAPTYGPAPRARRWN